MTITPLKTYHNRIKSGELRSDPVQEKAVIELQRLFDEIMEIESAPKFSLFQIISEWSGNKDAPPMGIYMYGGVGRGKSMLMDLFYDCLPAGVKKRRVHFHEFMIEVHDYIHSRSSDENSYGRGMVDQALPSLAALIASQSNILCFDEFHVVDITDAMLLGRLFKILFEHNVMVVATSNWAPDDLYKDGLQRERFLPFINLLNTKVNAIYLDSPHDYRTQTVAIEGTYFYPLGRATRRKIDDVFEILTEGAKPQKDIITVKGRDIEVKSAVNGIARFTFAQLCERPHGAEDYLEITRKYHSVFLENMPKLGYDRRNEAKRLMNFIDVLYEARTRLIISAATSIDKIYQGSDHAYEFERSVSRLLEMQGNNYP